MAQDSKEKKTTAKKSNAKGRKTAKPARTTHTRRRQGSTVFALDIGTRTVVGVLAEKTDSGYKITDMETAAHEKRSMTDGQIEDIEAVAEVIKTVRAALEKRQSVKLSHVCIAAAGRALKTMRAKWEYSLDPTKTITADDIKSAELEAVRKTEEQFSVQFDTSAFYCVGHSVISLTLDGYRTAKPEGHRGSLLETEMIAAFLPAYVVESLCAAVDIAGLDVAGLTLEPIAAMNAVVPQELRLINVALCDIGAGTSDVAVSRGGSVVAYGMATVAGDEVTEELMRSLLVDFPTAERIKTSSEKEIHYTDILLRDCTVTTERVLELIKPAAEQLSDVICREILSANGEAPQAVFLVGGGSRLHGLPSLVAKGLGMDEARVITGRRELMRGVEIPKGMEIGAEHTTPLGIALTAGRGISYDFTTITLNGRKIRALDTNRLTVFELLNFSGIKPAQLMGRSGTALTFTLNGARTTLRGTSAVPAEIIVNGKPAALNSTVRKGDEVNVKIAQDGENAAAYLSDYFDTDSLSAFSVSLFGEERTAGLYISVNGKPVTSDREIENGDTIELVSADTLGALSGIGGVTCAVLLNGSKAAEDTALSEGDVITEDNTQGVSEEAPAENTAATPAEVNITINGIPAPFPMREDGTLPIFLDVAAAFSDDPTSLLAHASVITLNGKIARLDEQIHDGDVIVIE